MAGTSQASPFVAGLVALLLERDPRLTPDAAKKLLRDNSRIPGRSRGTFDPKWGYGLIDATGLAKKAPPKKAPAKKAPAKKAPAKKAPAKKAAATRSSASPSRSPG
jgi:subtilisin family serine protease